MGEMIDFSMLRQSPFKGALDPIAAAVDQWAQQNHQRKMQEERLAQQKQVNDRIMARDEETQRRNLVREGQEERRLVGQQTLTNQTKVRATEDDVRKALAEASVTGDYSNAQRLIEGFSMADPTTGAVKQGLPNAGFKPHGGMPEPQRPTMAPLPPDIEQGPIPSPEDSTNAALIRAQDATNALPEGQDRVAAYPDIITAEMGRAAEEGSRFAAQQNRAPDQEQAQQADQRALEGFQTQRSEYDAAPPEVTLGGARQDPEAIRTGQGRMAAQGFAKVGDALEGIRTAAFESGDTEALEAVERKLELFPELMAGVESGTVDPKVAFKQLGALSVEQMKREAARERDAASMERTKFQGANRLENTGLANTGRVAAAKAGVDAREGAKAEARATGTNEKTYARVQADLSTFDKQHNVSTDRKEEQRMQTLMDNKDVQGVQRAMATQLARGLAGEKGALSNQDIARIQGDLGGAWGSIENWLSRKGTGDLDPAVLDQLVKSTQVVLAEKSRGRAAAEQAYAARFMKPTYFGQKTGHGEDLLNAFEEKFGHPYQPAAPQASGRSALGVPAGDDYEDPNNESSFEGEPQNTGGRIPLTPERAREILEERRRRRGR